MPSLLKYFNIHNYFNLFIWCVGRMRVSFHEREDF